MKRKHIQIDLPDEGDATTSNAIVMLLRDALAEFIEARKGDYVEKRYPEQSAGFRKHKKVSNESRLRLAAALQEAVGSVQINSYDDKYGRPVFYIP